LVFWLAQRPPAPGPGGNPSVATSLALTPAAPAAPPVTNAKAGASDLGIRPIQASPSEGSPAVDPYQRGASRRDVAKPESGDAFELPARGTEDGFDREEAERQVRAKLLDRPRHTRGKTKRNKAVSANATRGGEAVSSSEASGPSPRATKPPAVAAPSTAPEGAPSVVDGRRIRTSL
jgi:hypothetical protein